MGPRLVRGCRRPQPALLTVTPTREWLCGLAHEPLPPPPVTGGLDAVLLDRDGTLNVLGPGYRTLGDFELLPGAAESVARLNALGVPVVLVTNQRGISTGALTWDALATVHAHLVEQLAAEGAHLDDIRLCPHASGECTCRKPSPGLIDAVVAENGWIGRKRTLFVGDAESDEMAAKAAGVHFLGVASDVGLIDVVDSVLALWERPRSSTS